MLETLIFRNNNTKKIINPLEKKFHIKINQETSIIYVNKY